MNRAPTLTVATATMVAAAVPAAGCTRRRLCVERRALTVVIVFPHTFSWPRYVSQDCSTWAALSSALATKLAEEKPNSCMAVSWNTGRHPMGELRWPSPDESAAVMTVTRQPKVFTGTETNVSVAPG
jgi:hypothetical protein